MESATVAKDGSEVIIITGISDDFQKFISSRRKITPPDGYISKPVDHGQFIDMFKGLLD